MSIFKLILSKKKELFIITFFMIVAQLLSQGIPTLIKFISDSFIDSTPLIVLLVAGGLTAAGFVQYFSDYFADKYYWKFTNGIGLELLKEFLMIVMNCKTLHLSKMNPDELSRMATSDIQQLKEAVIKQYFISISTVIKVLTLLLFVLLLDYKLGLITIIWYILFYFVSKRLVDKISKDRINERADYTEVMALAKDAVYGNFDLKYYASYEGFLKHLEKINKKYISSHISLMLTSSQSRYLKYIGNFTSIAIIICYKTFISPDVSTGTVLAMYMYSINYSAVFNSILTLRTYSKDVKALKKPVEDFFKSAREKENAGSIICEKINNINFKNVSVSYDDKNVFGNFNCEFTSHRVYLINGKSGAGKTSLINALLGEIDYEGSIFFNDIQFENIDKNSLKEKIGIIHQNIYLIGGTVKENILLFNEKFSDKDLETAAKIVGIKDLTQHIGTSEIDKVSGGERKRIALARLMLVIAEKDLIILDETFANLDINSIQSILKEVLNKSKDKILIIISHDEAVQKFLSANTDLTIVRIGSE
ncbi:ABC transporter ATP-binding protein [Treponema sp. OMZ 792]|uniref:ATP-binding cassette domain-containing protein n=1 Tax=unclassified Treponema TaxID=2638727 RepID=UPI0020A3BBFC|nr:MULTISPECIES: ABC transporter ATP-binding protein [unclassified Treponema]UTC74004.1 ABC transporter ATP-binding protein [Treponema sp. OMZ 792]UTC80404.1 ABC transporter ATP-binding protein [Treponema sp. OMZ 798]